MMWHYRTMRTVVNIADHLLAKARKLARSQGTSVTAVFEASLQLYLAEHRIEASSPIDWSLPVTDADQPVAGIDFNDTSKLLNL